MPRRYEDFFFQEFLPAVRAKYRIITDKKQRAVREHSALDFIDQADEETLKSLRTVAWFIDCGDDDFLLDLSVAFHQKMRNNRVKSELRVRNGVHNWE